MLIANIRIVSIHNQKMPLALAWWQGIVTYHQKVNLITVTFVGARLDDRLDGDLSVVENRLDFWVERLAGLVGASKVDERDAAFGLEQNSDAQIAEFSELGGHIVFGMFNDATRNKQRAVLGHILPTSAQGLRSLVVL